MWLWFVKRWELDLRSTNAIKLPLPPAHMTYVSIIVESVIKGPKKFLVVKNFIGKIDLMRAAHIGKSYLFYQTSAI